MVGRASIVCKNATKYKKRQNVILVILLLVCIISYVVDFFYLHTEYGFPRFILILDCFICILVMWNRYRKIEIVGNCGISKWFGIHRFYVSDIKKRVGNINIFSAEDEFFIQSTKYHRDIFKVVETDENKKQLLGIIDSPAKGYVIEPVVERKYRSICIFIGFASIYEKTKLNKYGQVIDNAELIGGMDLRRGKVIPIYEFKDKQGKHMVWGSERIKESELEKRLHQKCKIYYAPGKTECVMEKY